MQFEGQHYSSKLSFGVAVVLKESERGRSLFCMIMSVSLACSSIRQLCTLTYYDFLTVCEVLVFSYLTSY